MPKLPKGWRFHRPKHPDFSSDDKLWWKDQKSWVVSPDGEIVHYTAIKN